MSKETYIKEAIESIIEYNEGKALDVMKRAVADGCDPVDILSEGFSAGIREVGDLFGKGRVFLPELMLAAEVMQKISAYVDEEVAAKGDAARIHVGVIAQEVADAFRAEGLDPMRYAIICYDEWLDSDAVTEGDTVVTPARKAGNRYGVRYEELLAFIVSAM